jgi:hypothetical protein
MVGTRSLTVVGTRSLTVFMDDQWGKEVELLVMYRQFDGYPEGHGLELAGFLEGIEMVNGIPCGRTVGPQPRYANGMGCLAAQVVGHFKMEPLETIEFNGTAFVRAPNPNFGRPSVGGIYLHKAGTRDCGEEYVYTVTGGRPGSYITIEVKDNDHTLFKGTPAEFLNKYGRAGAATERGVRQ